MPRMKTPDQKNLCRKAWERLSPSDERAEERTQHHHRATPLLSPRNTTTLLGPPDSEQLGQPRLAHSEAYRVVQSQHCEPESTA
jgi:hypothetical protein